MKTGYLLLVIICFTLPACDKPENDFALIKEVQKDCLLSKVFQNNKLQREYKYNDKNEITTQTIYNPNGQISTIINYVYAGKNIVEWNNNTFTETFTYDNKNRVISSRYCEKNSSLCCFTTMEYLQGQLLKNLTVECSNGYFSREEYEYLNKDNGTRYIRYYNKSGAKTGQTEYIVFNEKMIYPFYYVQPINRDPYVGIFSVDGGIIESAQLNEYSFPLKLNFSDGTTQTFEYKECR